MRDANAFPSQCGETLKHADCEESKRSLLGFKFLFFYCQNISSKFHCFPNDSRLTIMGMLCNNPLGNR